MTSSCLQNIRKAHLKPDQKVALEDVFLFWLTQRFKIWTKKKITGMFGFDTPVEETVFYQDVFHEGKVEGEIKRINEEISSYRELHEQSYLPDSVYEEKVRGLKAECRQLQQKLAELK